MSKSRKTQTDKGPTTTRTLTARGAVAVLIVVVVFAGCGAILSQRSAAQKTGTAATAPAAHETTTETTTEAVSPAAEGEPAATSSTDSSAEPAANDTTGERKTYDAPPPMTIDPTKAYRATITTPRGDIVVTLLPEIAPQTVNSFVFLAREGFYDGLTWHRVIKDFMAQGGDPTGTGTGGPGYSLPAEFTDKILFDHPGLLAMARTNDPNSAGSQFFITTAPTPHLNQQYTIFGEVVEGQDIVDNIPLRDPATASGPGEQIVKITITEGQ